MERSNGQSLLGKVASLESTMMHFLRKVLLAIRNNKGSWARFLLFLFLVLVVSDTAFVQRYFNQKMVENEF